MLRILLVFLAAASTLVLLTWLAIARPFVFSADRRPLEFAADPDALRSHTFKLATDFAPRSWQHVENLNRTADYIFEEFRKHNSRVFRQTYAVFGTEYHNVISEFGTSNSRGAIIVGAHYDAWNNLPGADDNASGVAGLLELGKLLSGAALTRKVVLVAYTLEEPPFFPGDQMGSAVHAASLKAANENVHLMISLEMIGYYSDQPGSQSFPLPFLKLFYPSEGNFIAVAGPMTLSPATLELKRAFARTVALPMYSINAPAFVPGMDLSDHRNYWRLGFDAVMITDSAFYRNTAYHTAADTPDRLDYQKMAQVVTGVYGYILGLPPE